MRVALLRRYNRDASREKPDESLITERNESRGNARIGRLNARCRGVPRGCAEGRILPGARRPSSLGDAAGTSIPSRAIEFRRSRVWQQL